MEHGPRKQCTKCKEEKPFSEFYNNASRKDGKTSNCKACMNAYHKANRPYYNAKHLEWLQQNRDHVNAYNREWVGKQGDEWRERQRVNKRTASRRRHEEAIQAYGGFCACCGETEIRFLQIDHIENNGAEHRRELRTNRLDAWLKRNGYPEGFQVLCANCNFAKHTNGGTCPHEDALRKVVG